MRRMIRLTSIAMLGLTLLGCTTDLEQQNKQVARRVFSEILSEGQFELAAELYSPEFVNHGIHASIGLQEDQAAARGWKQAFPDLTITPDILVAEGDLVTVRWIGRGTNTGSGNGITATGKSVELPGITIWRIVDGRITDEWSAFDQLALMQQLGLLPGQDD